MTLYETDFLEWTQTEAEKLRSGRIDELDLVHLAEEIESLGKRERSALVNRLSVLLTHHLKYDFQPERRRRSWQLTIAAQKIKIGRLLRDNQSLKPFLPDAVTDAYRTARLDAAEQTGLKLEKFPEECPYSLADLGLASHD